MGPRQQSLPPLAQTPLPLGVHVPQVGKLWHSLCEKELPDDQHSAVLKSSVNLESCLKGHFSIQRNWLLKITLTVKTTLQPL